jgi:hypothetical protein
MIERLERALTQLSRITPTRYSSIAGHDALWDRLQGSSSTANGTHVILYDGSSRASDIAAPPTFHPEYWLTPWDWALAASVRLAASPQAIRPGGFRCLIVDLLPASVGRGGRRRFKIAGAFAPWLRWYRPGPDRGLAFSFETLSRDLGDVDVLPLLSAASANEIDKTGLIGAWTSLLAAPTDRHTIANLVGPLVLGEGVGRATGVTPVLPNVPSIERLRVLISSAGISLDSDTHGVPLAPLIEQPGFPASIAPSPEVRFGLVDDQYEVGYHAVLATLLLGDKIQDIALDDGRMATPAAAPHTLTLRSWRSPAHLLAAAGSALSECPGWRRPRRLGSAVADVLYLDLRLFGDSRAGVMGPREAGFIDAVLALCEEFTCSLAGDDQLKAAMTALRQRRADSSLAPQALAALPLLLSCVDPSLPIVLFSSSQQREVLHLLRHRPNIITSFSKPFSSGYAIEGAAQASTERLVSATMEALRLHRLRRVWDALVEFDRALGAIGDELDIQEPDLFWRNGSSVRIKIDRSIVRILVDEYQRVLLHGHFADALLLPHNLLERYGSPQQIKPPDLLLDLEVLTLDAYRSDPREDWYALVSRALADPTVAQSTAATLNRALELKKPPPSDQRARDLRGAIRRLTKLLQGRTAQAGDLASEFRRLHRQDADMFLTSYGGVESLIRSAFEKLLDRARQEAAGQGPAMEAIAAYQYYSVLVAMRNARSHYLCRPHEHDASLEHHACWAWQWFLAGLTAFARGTRPVSPGAGTADDLIAAKLSGWLPNSTLPEEGTGPEYCDRVAAGVVEMQQRDLLRLSPNIPIPHWIRPA